MGETWSEPILTKVRVKVGANANGGKGFERWVAIFAGGYHPSGNPNDHAAYDPTATKGRSIWILDLKTGEPLAVRRFDTSGDCTDPANYDALNPEADMCYAIASTPAVYDTNNDGYADLIFVGDLGGNLWKWVIEGPGDDRVNDGSGVLSQPSWPFRKFFQAPTYQENPAAPIYHKSFFFPPAATFKSGTLWLALGSGERTDLLFEGDTTLTADNNRFYSMTDLDPHDLIDPAPPVLTEGDLLNVSGAETCADVAAFRGYYFVADEAEKFVTDVDVFSYFVLVSSYVPVPSLDPCQIGGEAFLYAFRIHCGEGFFLDEAGDPKRSLSTGEGLPTDPRVSIDTGSGTANRVIVSKQGGDIINIEGPPGFGAGIGLFYWRELTQ
jgi:type IV pilus assembly protein PilY1